MIVLKVSKDDKGWFVASALSGTRLTDHVNTEVKAYQALIELIDQAIVYKTAGL